jgi:hypothetical protein
MLVCILGTLPFFNKTSSSQFFLASSLGFLRAGHLGKHTVTLECHTFDLRRVFL